MRRFLELKVPPLALWLLAGGAMWWLRRLEWASIDLPGQYIVAGVLFLFGVFVAVRGVRAFRAHETTVNPMSPDKASAIVSHDVYRFTRNPMYLGLALSLVAFGLALGNLASLAVVVLFAWYMTVFQIVPEERALAEKFGDAYAAYRATARRWL